MINLILSSNIRNVQAKPKTAGSTPCNYKNNLISSSDSVSFSGQRYPSDVYSNWFVAQVKEFMSQGDRSCDESIKNELEKYRQESTKKHLFKNAFGKVDGDVAVRANDYKCLKAELRNEKLNTEELMGKKFQEEKEANTIFEVAKADLTINELIPICNLIQMEKDGKRVSVPNCIMLAGPNVPLNKELIEWTGEKANCNFVKLELPEDVNPSVCFHKLNKELESAGEKSERTLIYVNGFARFLNPKIHSGSDIEKAKEMMANCSKDYNATLIFSAHKPSSLDPIVLENSGVVKKIDVNIKKPQLDTKMPEKKTDECSYIDEPLYTYSSLTDFFRKSPNKLSLDIGIPHDYLDHINPYNTPYN